MVGFPFNELNICGVFESSVWSACMLWAFSMLELIHKCIFSLKLTFDRQSTPHYLKKGKAPAKMQIRVLCFGASITAGWSALGNHYYPYATRLSARLADELPTSHFSIDVDGSPGDTMLHGQYANRMQKDVGNAKVPYDWVMYVIPTFLSLCSAAITGLEARLRGILHVQMVSISKNSTWMRK